MARMKEIQSPAVDPGNTATWSKSHGTYIAGRAVLDECDALAAAMEAKWGCGRLRLLVSTGLREKFDRQRYLLNQACWHGDLEAVRREGPRMCNAWRTLDRVATAAGEGSLSPLVWEVTLKDGRVAAIVRDNDDAHAVVASGRAVNVYSLEEIARLLEAHSIVNDAKIVWPGTRVEKVRRSVDDPLDAFASSAPDLNDEISR